MPRSGAGPTWTGFPFEDVPYAVVSTQDRPTKNITLAVEAVRRLLRRDRVDMKLSVTARLEPGGPGDRLWRAVRDAGMALGTALSVPDLPREVHAALYHCAALTVHPSFYEGIVGALPFVESIQRWDALYHCAGTALPWNCWSRSRRSG